MHNRRGTKQFVMILLLIFAPLRFAFSQPQTQTQTQPAIPDTEIFLLDFPNGKPLNITHRNGYDNQPYFLPHSSDVFYTSIVNEQADIYRYNMKTGKSTPFTNTRESEYSAGLTPDGKYISVVRVETDKDKTQRLWKFPLAGGAPQLALTKTRPVGYYLWLSTNTLVAFILGEPNTLQQIERASESAKVIAKDIGRCLRKIPGKEEISFVQMAGENPISIESYNLKTGAIKTVVATLPGSEDYVWTPSGQLLSGKGSKLFSFDPAKDKDWKEIADFSAYGLKSITRLAIDPAGKKLAIVSEL
jgi:dipeptidyl aminopeptidase/acylaminoacyl peptidase